MQNVKRSFNIFILFSKFSLKSTFQGRMGVIFFTAGKILRFFFFFFLIFLIFGKIKIVKGYSFNQAVVFYLTFNLVDTISQILFREVYRFRYLVVSGNFDHVLLKPYHPFLRVLVGGVDFLDVILLLPYFLLTIYFVFQSGFLHFQSLVLYLALLINAIFIATAFHIMALSVGILTTEVDHTMMIYRDLTTLGRFPLEIYKEPIRGIFTFIIPIGIMMSFPPKALFNLLSSSFYFLAFAVSCILLLLSLQLWSYALKR